MAFTGATAGVNAGAQTGDTVLDWALEATWNVPPTGSYQQGRFTAETLSRSQTTARPSEINPNKEVSQSVVTAVSASGRISGGLSTGTYDDFFAGVLGADYISTKIVGSSDGTTGYGYTKSNTYTSDAPNIQGLDSSSIAIISSLPENGLIYINDATLGIKGFFNYHQAGTPGIIVLDMGALDSYLSTGTVNAGLNAYVQGPDIINGPLAKTYTIRKKILGAWLQYSGSFVNQVQLTFAQGQFAQVECDLIAANEVMSQANIASAELSAPSGNVHNTVDNFKGCTVFGVAPAGCITSASLTLARTGAKADPGNGHADACGMITGELEASGSISFYFRTWAEYQAALAGTQGPIIIKTADSIGNGYAFVFLNAALRNPQLQTDAVNKTYELKLDIEGNPAVGGGTFSIFRLTPGS